MTTNDHVLHDGTRRDNAVRDTAGDITLHAERLVAGVEAREWARVRVTKRIVTENRTITVPVRREELVVEYLDDATPDQSSPTPVHGSTEGVDSRVVGEYVLHEEVPQVTTTLRATEKVQLILDSQRSLVEVSQQVSHEELDVDTLDMDTRDDDPDRLARG